MNDIRTLQIGMTSSPFAGGLDRYYHGLLGELPRQGIRVSSILGGDQGSLVRKWARIRAAVGRALPTSDIIVSHFAPYAFAALDRFRSRPFAIHFHGPWADESGAEGIGRVQVAAKRELERTVYRRGGRVIVLSRAFALIVEREYGVPFESIRVVPGGIDCARFAPRASRHDARAALGLPQGRPIVVSVRRLVRAKGLALLIDAAVELRSTMPDVLVAIGGCGPLSVELAQRIRERGLEHNVRLLGFVDDKQLPSLYRAADLTIVPTIALEGFGLVVVESLAAGTPVLVTPIAGLPEVVTALDPALILADASGPAIARGIRDALSGAVPVPGSDACVRYARRFDWSLIGGRVADIYREIA